MSRVEDDYLDVLQNMESAIAGVFRAHPELIDHNVDMALEALERAYLGEARGKPPHIPASPLAREVYDMVGAICDWRLGREGIQTKDGQDLGLGMESLEVSEILLCLKRLRKSLRLWTKQGGRQGYLAFIRNFT